MEIRHDFARDDGVAIQDLADSQVGEPASVRGRMRTADIEHGKVLSRYWSIILRWTFHFASEHTLQLGP